MAQATLLGFSSLTAEEIVKRLAERDCWGELPGDFIVVSGSDESTTITSSAIGATPYYYCHSPEAGFVHGDSFFDVFKRSKLPWHWNADALRCLALLGHLLGQDTLHPRILRVPAACQVRFSDGEVRIRHSEFWRDLLTDPSADKGDEQQLHRAIQALEGAFSRLPLSNPVLSLSAGFDSRVLMALSLGIGIRPRVITQGSAEATDTRIARQLAAKVGWECERIQLSPQDYLSAGRAVAWATGGVKTAANWHTYLYPKQAGLETQSHHIVGSNGEFARTYYFGGSERIEPLRRVPALPVGGYFFARMIRRIPKFDRGWSFLGSTTSTLASITKSITAATQPLLSSRNILVALDGFYALERVRHFIGAGIACYRCHGTPVSPFLDAQWLRAVVPLARQHKLSDRFHRSVIDQFAPQLAGIPFNQEVPGPPVGYNIFSNVAALDEVKDALLSNMTPIAPLAMPEAIQRMVSRRQLDDIGLLMTLMEAANIISA